MGWQDKKEQPMKTRIGVGIFPVYYSRLVIYYPNRRICFWQTDIHLGTNEAWRLLVKTLDMP